ncbi:MAG: WD40 repeat domain-containing serine/threonine protein kinase [Myxococcota bacterium]
MTREWSKSSSTPYDPDELPEHYCTSCTALRYGTDPQCPECGKERPDNGWRGLDAAFDPFLGRVLNDRYLCSKQLGRGASSTIYRAESLSVPKRFAIKMVELDSGRGDLDDQLRTRIEREVRAVGMLRNPHIVRVYEMLEFDSGWMGLVMDYIDGQTIEYLVETGGPIPVKRALRLIRQFANGLSEAHDAGMIHRDIKPANLMVEQLPDGEDFAFILDFGVVRLDDEARMTKGFLGTPLFASPEQALMGELDSRSDIYSLGATLFYMLTGRAPFDRHDSLEALEAHIKQKAPTLREVQPDLPFSSRLEQLLADTLKKAPSDRPQDLIEFIQVVESVLEAPSEPMFDGAANSQASIESPYETDNNLDDDIAELGAESTRAGRPNSGEFSPPTDRSFASNSKNEFRNRPGTASGLQSRILSMNDADKSEARADSEALSASEAELRDAPAAFDESQFEMTDTSPSGYDRPQTNPEGLDVARSIVASQTIQIMPERHEPGEGLVAESSETVQASDVAEQLRREEHQSVAEETFGTEFARGVRSSAARHDHDVVLADDQNQVWLLEDDHLRELLAPAVLVTGVAICDGYIFTGQKDGTIGRYNLTSDDFQALYQDVRRAPISAIDCSRSGALVIAGSASGRVYLGRPDTPDFGWMRLKTGAPVEAIAVSQEGGLFGIFRDDRTLTIRNSENPRAEVASLSIDGDPRSAAFSRDGHLLAIAYASDEIAIFEVMSGRKLSSLPYDCDVPQSLYFSHDNVLHGFNSADGRLRRWNLTVSRPVRPEKTVAR